MELKIEKIEEGSQGNTVRALVKLDSKYYRLEAFFAKESKTNSNNKSYVKLKMGDVNIIWDVEKDTFNRDMFDGFEKHILNLSKSVKEFGEKAKKSNDFIEGL